MAILKKVMSCPTCSNRKIKYKVKLRWSGHRCVWTRERVCTWACLISCCCAQKNLSHCTMAGHRAREVVYWTDKTRTTPVSVQTERAQCLAHHGAVDRKGNNNSTAKWSFTLFSLPPLLPSHILTTLKFLTSCHYLTYSLKILKNLTKFIQLSKTRLLALIRDYNMWNICMDFRGVDHNESLLENSKKKKKIVQISS